MYLTLLQVYITFFFLEYCLVLHFNAFFFTSNTGQMKEIFEHAHQTVQIP